MLFNIDISMNRSTYTDPVLFQNPRYLGKSNLRGFCNMTPPHPIRKIATPITKKWGFHKAFLRDDVMWNFSAAQWCFFSTPCFGITPIMYMFELLPINKGPRLSVTRSKLVAFSFNMVSLIVCLFVFFCLWCQISFQISLWLMLLWFTYAYDCICIYTFVSGCLSELISCSGLKFSWFPSASGFPTRIMRFLINQGTLVYHHVSHWRCQYRGSYPSRSSLSHLLWLQMLNSV